MKGLRLDSKTQKQGKTERDDLITRVLMFSFDRGFNFLDA